MTTKFENFVREMQGSLNNVSTYLPAALISDAAKDMGVDGENSDVWVGAILATSLFISIMQMSEGDEENFAVMFDCLITAFTQNYENTKVLK